MSKQERSPYVKLLIDLLKTVIATFLFFLLSNNLIRAIFEDEQDRRVITFALVISIYFFYFAAFYIMHARRSMDDYSLNMGDRKYCLKEDFKEIVMGDGKRLAIIYAVLAVMMELIARIKVLRSLSAAFLPVFPIFAISDFPVLISLIGWTILTVGSIITILYSHHRVHVLKAKGKL